MTDILLGFTLTTALWIGAAMLIFRLARWNDARRAVALRLHKPVATKITKPNANASVKAPANSNTRVVISDKPYLWKMQ